jgi:GNAT superfamily N-acetyltransferase
MPDLLVPLYKLPSAHETVEKLREEGIIIRRAYPFELSRVRRFISAQFSESWADEAEACFIAPPINCWIAVHEKKCIGFACVESTARGFFGPTGVDPTYRGKGIGAALLLVALQGLRDMGYGYGIIGGAGPVEFYEKIAGATVIPGSSPGLYVDMLGKDE